VRSGFSSGIAPNQKAIPEKVRSGFSSGIAPHQKAIPEEVRSGFSSGFGPVSLRHGRSVIYPSQT
jgi:hypothetical protein